MKLGLLLSGGLGISILKSLFEEYKIEFVFTDKNSKGIIDFCQDANVPTFIGNPRANSSKEFLENKEVEVIASVNYLFLVEKDLIEKPKNMIFNVHGSLLPKYRGRTPHVWSIINNEKITGVTAHLIDEGCDTGDVIRQVAISIEAEDTGADILKKYELVYPEIVSDVLEDIKNNTIKTQPQDISEATYFGKRTPEDGRINWNWQKERIFNWVRAIADPYPGAFTYYQNQKVTIDKIKYVNFGFNYLDDNGKILNTQPIIIKTPNGAVEIVKYREREIKFVKGEKFQ